MRRTDGRTAHRVYHATLPTTTGNRSVFLRILSETPTTIRIRLSPRPSEPPLRYRSWTVTRDDLDSMINTKLAAAISTYQCRCGGTMSLYDGSIGQRSGVFFACNECEECVEV